MSVTWEAGLFQSACTQGNALKNSTPPYLVRSKLSIELLSDVW